MSKIVGDTGCPSCIEKGRDKTKNHLILFEDGGAYCNRCGYTTNWKEKDIPFKEHKEISDEELKELIEEFNSCPELPYEDRGLSLATVKRYGCKAGVHHSYRSKIGNYLMPFHTKEPDGTYKVTGYKAGIPKEFRKPGLPKYFCRGRVKDAALFGEQLLPKAPFKKLFITESPMDAMALYQAIKESNRGTKWDYLEPNVVALPHGTGSVVASLDRAKDKLKLAEEVILVFDNDDAGREAVSKAKSLVPTVKAVHLPAKDCNDMLLAGNGNELARLAMWGAETVKIDEVVDISEIEEDILRKPVLGDPWPWPTLSKATYGIREGEIIGVAGGVGVGKTEWKYQCIANDVLTTDRKVGVFDLEATHGRTGKAIVGKLLHKVLHKPDQEYDPEEVKDKLRLLKGRVKIYKHKGSKDWEDAKKAIRHMVVVEGCTRIYFDNLSAVTSHLKDPSAINMELNNIMAEVSGMAHELGFTFIYFSHLNPPASGPSHERGGKVLESQLTGSRAMIKWSNYIIGLERNKDPDLPENERNIMTVVLLKDREFGNVCKFSVFYDKDTGDLVEMFQKPSA